MARGIQERGRRGRFLPAELVIPGWSEGPDPESRDSGFDALHRPGMTACLLDDPSPHPRIRHKTFFILSEDPVAIARDKIVDSVAERLWRRAQYTHPAPAGQLTQHRQRRIRFEPGD